MVARYCDPGHALLVANYLGEATETDDQGRTMWTYEDPELTKNATVVLTPCDGEMMVRCVKCIEMWISF